MGTTRRDWVPDNCDCCGRDAEDCGMLETGWVNDTRLAAARGHYCRPCAHLLRIERQPEHCAWCAVLMVEEEQADRDGWGYYADAYGDLYPCCPRCLADRFGITARVRVRGNRD